jgi:DsbC/DsbD-like thiol-disulfide interchange protein
MKRIVLIIAIFLAASVGVCAQTVSGSVASTARRGGTVAGFITLNIPNGYHVNSNRPKSENLLPTTVEIKANGGARALISQYPQGKDKTFAFSENPLNIYEGRVVFRFKLKVPRNYRASTLRIRIAVNFQPCTDEVCYQPTTKRLILTARVSRGGR